MVAKVKILTNFNKDLKYYFQKDKFSSLLFKIYLTSKIVNEKVVFQISKAVMV